MTVTTRLASDRADPDRIGAGGQLILERQRAGLALPSDGRGIFVEPVSATPVTVVGAGKMGSALARALLAGGYDVKVWNRTPARAEPLRDAGATIAGSLEDAMATSDVTLMNVANQAVVSELLEAADARRTLRGKTLIQLTTGTPADGRRGQAFANDHGISYLDGAIMAYPRTIGTDAAVILFSGAPGGGTAAGSRNPSLCRR